jgi:Holliday junction resolvase RusA-like endonuclease
MPAHDTDEILVAILLFVPGPPKAKGRPRMTRQGHAYTPKETVEYENLVRLAWMQALQPRLPAGPIEAHITAIYDVPKSWSKRKSADARAGLIAPTRHDCDNIAKAALDALNGCAYGDDREVARLLVEKRFAKTETEAAGVWITLSPANKEEDNEH